MKVPSSRFPGFALRLRRGNQVSGRGCRTHDVRRNLLPAFCIPRSAFRVRSGFTLLEVLLAVTILVIISGVTYMTFSVVSASWKRGTTMADGLQHGDYVMEQLVMALRSAYYPDTKGHASLYGFHMEEGGQGPRSSDAISWVKIGQALVGSDCPYAQTPHRVKFWVEEREGESFVMVRSWQLYGQKEDFDPELVEAVKLSRRVVGFDCRVAWEKLEDTGEIDWLEEWEETNRVPTVAQLTLFLEPLEEGGDPLEIRRAVGIPVGPLSWR